MIVKIAAKGHPSRMGKHISLIGMMGVGKSSVAPLLAQTLERDVIEVDAVIEAQEGMPINEIFIAQGEAYFRRVECETIAKLIQLPPAVLSLGGGAFMWEATRELLLAETVVVWLSASVDILCSRLQNSGTRMRPLLNASGVDLATTVREMVERREPNYRLAHYRIDTNNHSQEDVVDAILTFGQMYE